MAMLNDADLIVKMQYIMIESNARDFFVACIARAHLMTIYTRDFGWSYIISVLKWLVACLHTWRGFWQGFARGFWQGFAFGDDLLQISGTTWPVLSSRSSSSSAVTLSMLSLLQSSPKASPVVQASYQPFQDTHRCTTIQSHAYNGH